MAALLALRLLLLTGPPADGLDCSNITSTSFRAAWSGKAPCCGLYLGLFRDADARAPSALVLAPSASEPEVSVTGLAPATAYTLRWRGRNTNDVNFGWGWGNWSTPFVCRTAASAAQGAAAGADVFTAVTRPAAAAVPALPEQAKTVRMYRVSEFSLDVDFLSNHSSGDAAGEAVLLSAFVHRPGSPGGLVLNQSCLDALTAACPGLRDTGAPCLACTSAHLPMPACGGEQPSSAFKGEDNAHFFCGASAWIDARQSPLSEYTVDYLPSPTPQHCVPHVINGTSYGCRDPGFGPYLSCDAPEYGFDNTPLHPLCNCQVSIDRDISKLDQNVCNTTYLRRLDIQVRYQVLYIMIVSTRTAHALIWI